MKKKNGICKFFNLNYFIPSITSVKTFIRTYGHHWFCKQSHDARDVKAYCLCLLHGPHQSFIQHMYMCWGLLVPAPTPQGSSNPSREVLCSKKDTSYFQRFQSLHTPCCKERHTGKDELSLCIDVWTFLLFKSLKTGLIILVLQKQKFLCCKNRENKMHWWSLNDPETKIIIVVINYITWRPTVVSQRSNPENSEVGKFEFRDLSQTQGLGEHSPIPNLSFCVVDLRQKSLNLFLPPMLIYKMGMGILDPLEREAGLSHILMIWNKMISHTTQSRNFNEAELLISYNSSKSQSVPMRRSVYWNFV